MVSGPIQLTQCLDSGRAVQVELIKGAEEVQESTGSPGSKLRWDDMPVNLQKPLFLCERAWFLKCSHCCPVAAGIVVLTEQALT